MLLQRAGVKLAPDPIDTLMAECQDSALSGQYNGFNRAVLPHAVTKGDTVNFNVSYPLVFVLC